MIVSFKFFMMNFVDFVIDCYSHITSHVSQVFTSCTYYTSYSLLNFVHVIVCVYGQTNHVLQILWILCKIYLLLENLWRMQEILFLGNLGLKFLFWKSYHHILMQFVLIFQCFELILNVFQKTMFFLKFSEPLSISIDQKFLNMFERASVYFNRSNSFQNLLIESLSVSIDRSYFSIDRNSWNMFFLKGQNVFFKRFFFKKFQPFLSLRLG